MVLPDPLVFLAFRARRESAPKEPKEKLDSWGNEDLKVKRHVDTRAVVAGGGGEAEREGELLRTRTFLFPSSSASPPTAVSPMMTIDVRTLPGPISFQLFHGILEH